MIDRAAPVRNARLPLGRGTSRFPRQQQLNFASFSVLALAAQPDFDAFFGGLEAAVAAGGVLVIALVVVLAVRRLTSF